MKSKKIANIVFYNFYEDSREMKQACIFYNDGTVKNISFDEGIDAVVDLLRKESITSDELSNIINNNHIYTMSGYEFEKNFQKFIVKEDISNENNQTLALPIITSEEEKTPIEENIEVIASDNSESDELSEEQKETPSEKIVDSEAEEVVDEHADDKKQEEEKSNVLPLPRKNKTSDNSKNDNDFEERPLKAANETSSKKKKKKTNRFFTKVKNFFHRRKVRIGAALMAVVVALGGSFLIGKNESRIGKFINNKINKLTTKKSNNTDNTLIYGDNDYYDDYSYADLLKVNTVESQKTAMKKIHYAFTKFNKMFANSHLEEGKDIKAALSWTEMNALQQAYNNYSPEEIKAIFNGSRINANEFSQAYKNANLQLMGAHVIETRQDPVDLSVLIDSQEGKDFYRKYHEMFLQIKEAEGQDKIDKVNAWRQSLLEDFPISDDIREIGIAHSDNRLIEQYKLSVVPMVSAVEIMYQNLPTDNTLSEKTINYFNDTGLCNLADDTFERIERVTEMAEENNAEPLYVQYENAITAELEAENNYNIDDAHRELTLLDAFQDAVNEHNHEGLESSYSTSNNVAGVYTTTDTHTETTTEVHTTKEKTKTSNREEAVKKSSEKAVKEAEDKVNKKDAKWNEEQKKKGEEAAEQKRQELQSEADKHAEEVEKEIKDNDADLQKDIDKANDQIDKNNSDTDTSNDTKVNESDFGDHNVDFDDNHSDSNGNLDDSVKDVTTDSSKDQSNQDLPDPNATGKTFEENYPKTSTDPEYVPEATISNQAKTIIEYEEPVVIEDVDYTADVPETISNEEIANMIVENMANNTEEYTEGYQYTK